MTGPRRIEAKNKRPAGLASKCGALTEVERDGLAPDVAHGGCVMSVSNSPAVAVGGAGSGRSGASTADGSASATRTPQGSALGTSRIMPPLSTGAQARDRRERYARRSQSARWLISDAIAAALPEGVEEVEQGQFVDTATGEMHAAQWVRPPRPARCSWRIGDQVGVHADAAHAHFSGTERCGSIWSCPVCASVIRAERAREITQAVEAHQAQGGSVIFVTLTLRHKIADPLAVTLDTALEGWRVITGHRQWRGVSGMKRRYSISGYVRATEVTHGEENGWHPHLHSLLFTDRALSDVEVRVLGDELHGLWSAYAQRRTGRTPSRDRGIDAQRVDEDGRVLAQYLGKVQDGTRWTASAEMARSDVKTGRGQHLAPFQLLDDDQAGRLPVPARRRLWAEYVAATKGRRAVTWSRGLKARYDVGEKSDEDILDDTESAPAVWVVHRAAYDTARRSAGALSLALGLEAASRGDLDGLARILPGHPPPAD